MRGLQVSIVVGVLLLANESVANEGSPSSLEVKVLYDDWKNDFNAGDKGRVVTSTTTLKHVVKDTKADGGKFSFEAEGGYVWSTASREGSSRSIRHATDTTLKMAFEHPFAMSAWSWEVVTNFNLPTGLTKASELQLLSKPSIGVGGNFLGKGLETGLAAVFSREEKGGATLSLGGGTKYRGSYNPTEDNTIETADDDVDAGYEYSAFGSYTEIPLGEAEMSLKGKYTRTQGYAGKVTNSFILSFGVEQPKPADLRPSILYTVSLSDNRPDQASAAARESEFQKGITNKLEAGLEYSFGNEIGKGDDSSKSWTLESELTGELNDLSRPAETSFFATSWSLGGTAGVSHRATEDITASVSAKYAQNGSDNNEGKRTRFSVWTGILGVKIKF